MIYISFITEDSILIEMVKIFSERYRDIFTFYFAHRPIYDFIYDLIITPVCFCREIKQYKDNSSFFTPVMAYGSPSMIQNAYLSGSIDYLKKPWKMEELGFRVMNYIKHYRRTFRKKSIILENRKLIIGDKTAEINHKEYLLLKILYQHFGRLVHKRVIEKLIWGKTMENSKALDMLIMRVRKKIDKLSFPGKKIIKTVKPIGYLIPDDVEV